MVVAPHLKWVRDMMETPWFIAPVAVAYIMLLIQSWEPDTLSLMMPGDLEQGMATGDMICRDAIAYIVFSLPVHPFHSSPFPSCRFHDTGL